MADHDRYCDPYEDDPEYDIPLQDKRPFGSGLKRKRVVFVPASSGNLNTTEKSTDLKPSKSISDLYLSLVLPKDGTQDTSRTASEPVGRTVCEVCNLPLDESPAVPSEIQTTTRPHEASLAHQVCMAHSHPPSALDRSRMGMSVLQSQGWDPDARRGLGASQQGIQFPLKAKPKEDNLGIGVEVPKDFVPKKKEKVQTYDAKRVRKMAAEDKKRMEKLREQVFGNSDVEKYLGGGG
ncbi:hypothetical protein DL764_002480 [Monosporascus ibericus]|uniref:G-patch domain-containing protein n=1 Tax=Monosporascus ibericus TaxID=155417 RepID=A0A4Q4TPX9_9PEZI|nr:hypothetical protein DL764_002480 [Monosporascus ibericus]